MPSYPGRPREFTHSKRRELIFHIHEGATVEEAAQIVGISLRTVQREARHNEHFDHDLQLAVHAAPVDPEKLVQRAARTHWRAAAWLLERTDPDRFAKRPPNSCSSETLMDISNWLIETALEATPAEHREAVYRRMRAVADKALDVVMPDQHVACRTLVRELPQRPMPLSEHEWVKTLKVVRNGPDPAAVASSTPLGALPAAGPDDKRDAGGVLGGAPHDAASAESPTRTALLTSDAPRAQGAEPGAADAPSEDGSAISAQPTSDAPASEPNATIVEDPVAWYRRHPLQRSLSAGRPSDNIQGHRLLDSDAMDSAWLYLSPEEEEQALANADLAAARKVALEADARSPRPRTRARSSGSPRSPSIGGIMSPKV